MTEEDKIMVIKFFLRVLANQALIISALSGLTASAGYKDMTNKLNDETSKLLQEIIDTAKMLNK